MGELIGSSASAGSARTPFARVTRGLLLGAVLATTTSGQLDVDFVGTPTSGVNPVSVSFSDTTTGATPFFWTWNFGDGGTSAEQNPTHIYTAPGPHTVTLNVIATGFMLGAEIKLDYITVDPAPLTVDFDASPTQGVQPLQVAFSDMSSGATTAWSWDFGDGQTSTLQNPTHTYVVSETTSFDVSLTAFIGQQNDTLVKTSFITVDPAPLTVDFDASPTEGVNPLFVQFTDTSTGAITAWSWDFGDGKTSTQQHPQHTYILPGDHSVSLTAFIGLQEQTELKPGFITVGNAPLTVDFSESATQGFANLKVDFSNESTGPVTSWKWDFGDGFTSIQANPSHTYFNPGTYSVSLTAFVGLQTATFVKTDLIHFDQVDFNVSPAQGGNPLPVSFTDTSIGTTTAWNWDFGDGTGSTLQNPTHTYHFPGAYDVSLEASFGPVSDTRVKASVVRVLNLFTDLVLFEEDFDQGFPASWSNILQGSNVDIWETGANKVNGSPDMLHEWFCAHAIFFRDNILLSPPIDLTAVDNAELSFDQFHLFASSIDYNALVVTTDRGLEYSVLKELVSPAEGFSGVTLSLDDFIGEPAVQIGFHYQGVVANEWSLDNILVTSRLGDPFVLGDRVLGELGPGEVHLVQFEAVEGSRIQLRVKRRGGSGLEPAFRVGDPDGVEIVGLADTAVSPKSARIPNDMRTLAKTGIYSVEISDLSGLGGTYELRSRAKHPRKIGPADPIKVGDPEDPPQPLAVPAISGARIRSLRVTRVKPKGAFAAVAGQPADLKPSVGVASPAGNELVAEVMKVNPAGTRLLWKGINLPTGGVYAVEVGGIDDSVGYARVAIRLQYPMGRNTLIMPKGSP